MSFKGLLNIVCKIQSVTLTQHAVTRRKVKSWSNTYTGVKCRLDQNSGREFAAPSSIKSKADHVLFLEKKYSITEKSNRIVIGSDTYNILSVQDGGGHEHHLELLLQKIL